MRGKKYGSWGKTGVCVLRVVTGGTGVDRQRKQFRTNARHQSHGAGVGLGGNQGTRERMANNKKLSDIAQGVLFPGRREACTSAGLGCARLSADRFARRPSQYSINGGSSCASDISGERDVSKGCPPWAAPVLVSLLSAVLITLMYGMFHR